MIIQIKPQMVDCKVVGIWRVEILSEITDGGKRGVFMSAYSPDEPIGQCVEHHEKLLIKRTAAE